MGRKRKPSSTYDKNTIYDLPKVGSSSSNSNPRSFKPEKEEFTNLLEDAFQSRLSNSIIAGVNQTSRKGKESLDNVKEKIKAVEMKRARVPPGTFEELDTQYGGYWTANTCKRLNINALTLYKLYVEDNFDKLFHSVGKEKTSVSGTSIVKKEEETRSIVVPLSQVLRKDLPPSLRADLIKKLTTAITQYSDFSCILSFMVWMTMVGFVTYNSSSIIDLKAIIPQEFQTSFKEDILLPDAPVITLSSDDTYNDYKNLFSLTHLQIMSTLNFGASGAQVQTNATHSRWVDLNGKINSETSQQLQDLFDLGKSVNSTIKKSAIALLSTNIDNMYQNNKRFYKTLDRLLLVLLREKKYDKVERVERKISHIKGLSLIKGKKPAKNRPKIEEEDEEEDVDSNDDVPSKRLARIKGSIKWMLLSQNEQTLINKENIGITNISDEEFLLYSKIFDFLSPYIPKKEERSLMPAQIPLLILANSIFEPLNYKKFKVKLCPRPPPSSFLSLPVDTAMLYTLMTNFGDTKYNLISKERYPITSLPVALKRKPDVFASVFDLTQIQDTCNSRKLGFIHRVLIRPGLITCVLNGSRFVKKNPEPTPKAITRSSIADAKINQDKDAAVKKVEEEIRSLQKQLRKIKQNFNLGDADQAIKALKRARNLMVDDKDRATAALQIRKMKRERWGEYKSMKEVNLQLKDARHRMYTARSMKNANEADSLSGAESKNEGGAESTTIQSADQIKFGGSDYGLQTMSVTVGISHEMFNKHISYYNNTHPENPLPADQELDPQFHPLPKAHKLSSKNINHLCLKYKMAHSLEKKKKTTDLGKQVSSIEDKLSKLPNSLLADAKEYFIYNMKERKVLRSFYFSPKRCRWKRTGELATIRTKDRVAASERQFIKGDSKNALFMAIGNAGTGVGSSIKGYDRRGGKWLPKLHARYATVKMTDEYMTSQLCVYCYFPITHTKTSQNTTVLGTTRCLNVECEAFKQGRASNNRDVMSATAIGISAMTKYFFKKDFPPFSRTKQ